MEPKTCLAPWLWPGYQLQTLKISDECPYVAPTAIGPFLLDDVEAVQPVWPSEFELGMELNDVTWIDVDNPVYCATVDENGVFIAKSPPPEEWPMIQAEPCEIVKYTALKKANLKRVELWNEEHFECIYGWDINGVHHVVDFLATVCPGDEYHTAVGIKYSVECENEDITDENKSGC